MKKLIVAAFAVAFAASVQAAAVTWSCTAAGTTLPDGSVANGVVAYLFTEAVDTVALQSALDAGSWNPTTTTGYLTTKNASSTGAIMQAGLGSFLNETVTFSMVLFDTAAVGASGNYKVATLPVTFTDKNATANFTNNMKAADWVAYGVPEPTSGLLLLIGMAGLALKRKQA